MDKIDLEELERLAAQATPGPWETKLIDNPHYFGGRPLWKLTVDGCFVGELHQPYTNEVDAAYIAAACNAAPSLTAKVRELERQSEALAFWLAQFLPHAECPIFEDCPLSHKKNVDVRDCAKQLIQGVLDHD